MANNFSQIFTLKDLFNNKKLAGKLPLINYREKELDDGRISYRTNAKSVSKQVFDTAVRGARPYYKPVIATKHGDTIEIGGTLVGDYDEAVEGIYRSLVGIKSILIYTANNADMIRDALKESEKNKRGYGTAPKLHLKVQSMEEIEGMSTQQLNGLMNNIMEDIIYSDNFPKTQRKYGVENFDISSPYNYDQRRLIWKMKVGEL